MTPIETLTSSDFIDATGPEFIVTIFMSNSPHQPNLANSVDQAVKRYLEDLNGEEATGLYALVLAQVEKPLLEVIMRHCEDNQSKASRALGINRNTLRKKLSQYNLD